MPRPSAKRSIETLKLAPARRLSELLAALGRYNSLRDPIAAGIEAKGLTPSQVHCLMWVGHDRRLTMGELARRLGVTEKTITGIVDRLERAALVRRVRNEVDRRVVLVELTAEGSSQFTALDRAFTERIAVFLELLEQEDCDALFRMLERLISRLLPPEAAQAALRPETP